MPKSKLIIAVGFFIALLPWLGFPHGWDSFFEVVGGLSIIGLSVAISIDKRLMLKAKAEKRQIRRRTQLHMQSEAEARAPAPEPTPVPAVPERRRRFGRRATDQIVAVENQNNLPTDTPPAP